MVRDPHLHSRFERKQANLQQRHQVALEKSVAKASTPSRVGRFNWDNLPEALKRLNEFLFEKLATSRDDRELGALAHEIEARFQDGASGVLIKRLVRRRPDSAGNFLPEYVGLQVAGTGATRIEALTSYQAARRAAFEPPAEDKSAVCTAANPTGRPVKAQAVLRAAPKGFNFGYASAMAARIAKTYEDNPANLGPIEVAGHALPIQPRSYLEESFFFIGSQQWADWKASRAR